MTWLVFSVLLRFILPDPIEYYTAMALGVVFFTLPDVYHVRIFNAIRRQNNQLHAVGLGQNITAIYKREKKAAVNVFKGEVWDFLPLLLKMVK